MISQIAVAASVAGSVLGTVGFGVSHYLLHSKYAKLVAALELRLRDVEQTLVTEFKNIKSVVSGEADSLKAHSVDLRNHAKQIHDVARATSAPRTVPTR